MQLYKCKVRLSSSLNNEVPKINVTVPEIIVLRVIHQMGYNVGGGDPVVDIEPLIDGKNQFVMADRSDREERQRLHDIYGGALLRSKTHPTIDSIFGVGTPLPTTTDGIKGQVNVGSKPVRAKAVPGGAMAAEKNDLEGLE